MKFSKRRRNKMKNNKLIAEFMGLSIKAGVCYYTDENNEFPMGIRSNDNLPYDTSWDWLMPVVEKIDNLFGEDDIVDDMINKVHNAVLQFNRDITYNAVVEFINQLNK